MLRAFTAISFAFVLWFVPGCGSEIKQREIDPLGAAPPSEQDKIREALKKFGVTKDILVVIDTDPQWLVTVKPEGMGANGEPPPDRPLPEKYLVHKSTFQVTKATGDDPSRKRPE